MSEFVFPITIQAMLPYLVTLGDPGFQKVDYVVADSIVNTIGTEEAIKEYKQQC